MADDDSSKSCISVATGNTPPLSPEVVQVISSYFMKKREKDKPLPSSFKPSELRKVLSSLRIPAPCIQLLCQKVRSKLQLPPLSKEEAKVSVEKQLQDEKRRNILLQALALLVPVAASLAVPPISKFHVGVVGLGENGDAYLGGNIEIPPAPLNTTIHAEQCMISAMHRNGEKRFLALLAIVPACGHCRQFLRETAQSMNAYMVVASQNCNQLPIDLDITLLGDLLPQSFGPESLEIPMKEHLLCPQPALQAIQPTKSASDVITQWKAMSAVADQLDMTLLESLYRRGSQAAQNAYAPYTHSPCGLAAVYCARKQHDRDGEKCKHLYKICSGSYLENAAYNPSLQPMQYCFSELLVGRGLSPRCLILVIVAELKNPTIRQFSHTQALLSEIAPKAIVLPLQVE